VAGCGQKCNTQSPKKIKSAGVMAQVLGHKSIQAPKPPRKKKMKENYLIVSKTNKIFMCGFSKL
jgi:hypothetical protein